MKVLYIGSYSEGSTSKMRCEVLAELIGNNIDIIDTETPFIHFNKIYKSLGWRYKRGPYIDAINKYAYSNVKPDQFYNIIWVDKGIFFKPKLIKYLKTHTKYLIHYTPDTAFVYNKSRFFNRSVSLYDLCITTKSFEVDKYKYWGAVEVYCATQGYNKSLHKPIEGIRKEGVVFIGQYEKYRKHIVLLLINSGVDVKLGGPGWYSFVKKNRDKSNLTYHGTFVGGAKYVKLISSSQIGLGLLSKKFEELHTTRTFEIPACGTLLATEYNTEVSNIFSKEEVIFFSSPTDLIIKILSLLGNEDLIRKMTEKGYRKVTLNEYDYKSIIKKILEYKNII